MIAADRGYSRSYYWMAGIYLEGLGVDKDIKKAELYYQKSAECGYLAGKGGLARVQATKGGLSRLVLLPRLIVLAVAAFFIAYKNKDDSRIVDVTNYFEAKGAK